MPKWVRTSLIVLGQILVIWVAVLVLCAGFTLAGLDPLHRPLGQQMREMIGPGLAFAVLIRIFKFNRLVQIFKSDE